MPLNPINPLNSVVNPVVSKKREDPSKPIFKDPVLNAKANKLNKLREDTQKKKQLIYVYIQVRGDTVILYNNKSGSDIPVAKGSVVSPLGFTRFIKSGSCKILESTTPLSTKLQARVAFQEYSNGMAVCFSEDSPLKGRDFRITIADSEGNPNHLKIELL